jgi:hypothetical protein
MTLVPPLAPPRLGRDRRATTGAPSPPASWHSWRSPCVSELASSEVPGCGHASCRSAAARSQPRPAPSPVAADPSPAMGLACDASVRRPVGGPPAAQLATARSRRVTFHPYKGTEQRRTVAAVSGEESRSPGRGKLARSSGASATRSTCGSSKGSSPQSTSLRTSVQATSRSSWFPAIDLRRGRRMSGCLRCCRRSSRPTDFSGHRGRASRHGGEPVAKTSSSGWSGGA